MKQGSSSLNLVFIKASASFIFSSIFRLSQLALFFLKLVTSWKHNHTWNMILVRAVVEHLVLNITFCRGIVKSPDEGTLPILRSNRLFLVWTIIDITIYMYSTFFHEPTFFFTIYQMQTGLNLFIPSYMLRAGVK